MRGGKATRPLGATRELTENPVTALRAPRTSCPEPQLRLRTPHDPVALLSHTHLTDTPRRPPQLCSLLTLPCKGCPAGVWQEGPKKTGTFQPVTPVLTDSWGVRLGALHGGLI